MKPYQAPSTEGLQNEDAFLEMDSFEEEISINPLAKVIPQSLTLRCSLRGERYKVKENFNFSKDLDIPLYKNYKAISFAEIVYENTGFFKQGFEKIYLAKDLPYVLNIEENQVLYKHTFEMLDQVQVNVIKEKALKEKKEAFYSFGGVLSFNPSKCMQRYFIIKEDDQETKNKESHLFFLNTVELKKYLPKKKMLLSMADFIFQGYLTVQVSYDNKLLSYVSFDYRMKGQDIFDVDFVVSGKESEDEK